MKDFSDLIRAAQANLMQSQSARASAEKRLRGEEAARRARIAREAREAAQARKIALGGEYNEVKLYTLELNDRLHLIDDRRLSTEERAQAHAEAEEFQGWIDAFWYKYRNEEWFLGHPYLEAAQRAWSRSQINIY